MCVYFDSTVKKIAFQKVTERGTTGKNLILLETLTEMLFTFKSDWEVGVPAELGNEVT